ncbi:MAG: phospholipase D-like domain-containing protein [Chloroflexi bacterium]|nr:phospholipase D-like domain-containing protein [Chloroflexota bacterium]
MANRKNSKKPTIAGVIFILVILAIFYLYPDLGNNSANTDLATSSPISENTTPTPVTSNGNQTGSSLDWLTVYFTNPNPPDNTTDGIDQYVIPLINQAKKSIDVASFDLNLPSFINALADASKRGVQVRIVYDGKNGNQKLEANRTEDGKEFDAIAVLNNADIAPVDGGRSSGLMHDKMIIIDSETLFMGSWNMSYNDTFRNNNNLLKITNPQLIANYQAKFNELFIDQRFGTHATVGALNSQMNIDGVQVENYFSPSDQVTAKLVAYVNNAKKSIHFMIFTFTDKDIASAMIERYNAGVDVSGTIEDRGASQGAFVPLFCAKVPTKVDGNKYTMHHKVMVIDESIVITGSFNFTNAADNENDDNIIVIHDPTVARLYLDELERVSGVSKDPKPGSITCK